MSVNKVLVLTSGAEERINERFERWVADNSDPLWRSNSGGRWPIEAPPEAPLAVRAWARARIDAYDSGDKEDHGNAFNSGVAIDSLADLSYFAKGPLKGHSDCWCRTCEDRWLRSLDRTVLAARVMLRDVWIREGGRTRRSVVTPEPSV